MSEPSAHKMQFDVVSVRLGAQASLARALADPQRTRLVLVAHAQRATLREVARTHDELAAIGLTQQYVVINGVLPRSEAAQDPLAAAIFEREQAALPDVLRPLPTDQVPLKAFNLVGLAALRQLLNTSEQTTAARADNLAVSRIDPHAETERYRRPSSPLLRQRAHNERVEIDAVAGWMRAAMRWSPCCRRNRWVWIVC